MSITTPNEFFLQKKILLKQCLTLSEDLKNGLEIWENFEDILKRREEAIEKIRILEESAGKSFAPLLSQEMKAELDQILKQILELDKQTTELMRKAQREIMTSLKNNVQGQKMIQYGSALGQSNGRFLDYKK